MKQYTVTGMSCAACSARVEKAVLKTDGVTSCAVNLLTGTMNVEGYAAPDAVIAAVVTAGYGASVKNLNENSEISENNTDTAEVSVLKRRLFSSIGFLVLLMYVSMGHTMWGFPLPKFFDGNYIATGLLQLLLTICVMIINGKFFVNGFKGLIRKAPNMDTLVALGSGAAFVYSTYALFAMTGAQVHGGTDVAAIFVHEFYFESSAMILTLITVGKMLEAHSKGKTTDALKSLISLAPKTAIVIRNGEETEISASDVKKGDIFIVKPGAGIPADGIIIEGKCSVNEAALTGESIPVDKGLGDSVSAATINTVGFIKCEAVKVGEDTVLSQIIRMVSDAASTKAPIAKSADKVSGIFVPCVMAAALITIAVWRISGADIGFALARGISVLVISCPCALGLATPVAIMVASGIGAKNGILFKNAASLEETGRIQIAALDKTGTITLGEPEVTDIIPLSDISETELLSIAYSLETGSEHPLAKAIVKKASSECTRYEVSDFEVLAGNGLRGKINGSEILGGNMKFVSENTEIPESARSAADKLSESGKTPMFFTSEGSLIGIIAAADSVKEDSPRAVRELHDMGIHVVILTGDNERTANAVKVAVGADEVIAGVMPRKKESVIRELKKRGKTAMVGDGINDAPALTSADIGIAIGSGTDVAADAADIVLMKSRLSDVPDAIRLSRKTLKNIRENLFWAFIYNIIGIPLAAGVWIPLFDLKLNPMFGAAAMSLSSFCVVTNALRLNLFDIHSSAKDKKIKQKKEKKAMETTMKIEGMMCGHCEARVKACLEGIDGVVSADVSHKENKAVIELSKEVSAEVLKKTVEDAGYTVID